MVRQQIIIIIIIIINIIIITTIIITINIINPFGANVPILYALKTPENF